jgi:MYXO-CTERM domain-containing protein
MAHRHWISASVLVLGFGSGAFLTPRAAMATTCTADQDCVTGFVCQVVGGSGCPAVACPAGQDCPPPPPCEPVEYKECVPGPCQADADCADGMLCLEHSSTLCTGSAPACSPDQECPQPEPEQCTTTTERSCVPKYMAPCTADIDCGEGFTCVETEQCGCSGSAGSAGTPTPGGAEPAPAPEPMPECTCTKTGVKHCQITEIPCTDATQCPGGWSCEQTGGVSGCTSSSDGRETCEPTTTTSNQCMPPYYSVAGGWIAEDGSFTGQPASGAAREDNGAGTTTVGATGGGGCQVGHGGVGGAAGVLLLMLGLLPLRRRQKRAS